MVLTSAPVYRMVTRPQTDTTAKSPTMTLFVLSKLFCAACNHEGLTRGSIVDDCVYLPRIGISEACPRSCKVGIAGLARQTRLSSCVILSDSGRNGVRLWRALVQGFA
jgi:hypothetical protein